jgi:hypothetical protein
VTQTVAEIEAEIRELREGFTEASIVNAVYSQAHDRRIRDAEAAVALIDRTMAPARRRRTAAEHARSDRPNPAARHPADGDRAKRRTRPRTRRLCNQPRYKVGALCRDHRNERKAELRRINGRERYPATCVICHTDFTSTERNAKYCSTGAGSCEAKGKRGRSSLTGFTTPAIGGGPQTPLR